MARKGIFDLPPELRNLIYSRYLHTFEGGVITPKLPEDIVTLETLPEAGTSTSQNQSRRHHGAVSEPEAWKKSTAPALLSACKQVHREEVSLFIHSQRTLITDLSTFDIWLSTQSNAQRHAIRHLALGPGIAELQVLSRQGELFQVSSEAQAHAVVKVASNLPCLVTLEVEMARQLPFRVQWLEGGFEALEIVRVKHVAKCKTQHDDEKLDQTSGKLSASEQWWQRVHARVRRAVEDGTIASIGCLEKRLQSHLERKILRRATAGRKT
ncbi:hypothetical protein B0A55_09435 [Friedmanniomyces simplex]|uniref:DUF7730 domain-containing protein n=1 Tax=Friedmanniomyces simplex TaxID=329884 RepID=A0A4U0WNY0_9PEZI|nr:hypothetical protein B0A55_09435 [Friedmanniomyces simplex]